MNPSTLRLHHECLLGYLFELRLNLLSQAWARAGFRFCTLLIYYNILEFLFCSHIVFDKMSLNLNLWMFAKCLMKWPSNFSWTLSLIMKKKNVFELKLTSVDKMPNRLFASMVTRCLKVPNNHFLISLWVQCIRDGNKYLLSYIG